MIDFYSEPFSATGNASSEGQENLLGRPRLDPLTVLVREAVQNCWDAHVDGPQVRVSFDLVSLSGARRQAAEVLVAADALDRTGLRTRLGETDEPQVLVISDRGTRGLGGPIRADVESYGVKRDFVDLLRNIGQPPDNPAGGGTFGFGKAALFRSSAAHSVLLHSRCRVDGQIESRLMGAALGGQFSAGGLRYTGRHWWGRIAADGVVDPVVGDEGEEFAAALGFPPFMMDELGTSIGILLPVFGDRSREQAMRFIRRALLWHFWPKMVADADLGLAPMAFGVSIDGQPLSMPDPAEVPHLQGFVEALRLLNDPSLDGDTPFSQVLPIRIYRPQRQLGSLALRRYPPREAEREDVGEPDDPIDLDRAAHHVALLRTPELVVRYVDGQPLEAEIAEYAGVFRCESDLDRVYASSEPPTHDDWVPAALTDRTERSIVKMTFERIQQAIGEAFAPADSEVSSASAAGVPLAEFSGLLGELLPGLGGPGARVQARRAPPGGRGARGIRSPATSGASTGDGAGVSAGSATGQGSGGRGSGGDRPPRRASVIAEDQLLAERQGERVLEVRFHVNHAGPPGTLVAARCGVVLEGGDLESEAPAGAEIPRVLAWEVPLGTEVAAGETCLVDSAIEGTCLVAVTIPPDAEVAVDLEVSREPV